MAVTALAAACVGLAVGRANAGGLVARGGGYPHVDVESAWIIWDPSSQREELIVAAQFSRLREPFAWVLPVPAPAEVGPVDADLRLALSKLIAGYQRRAPRWTMPSRESKGPLASLTFGDPGTVSFEQVKAAAPDALPRLLGAPMARQYVALDEWVKQYAEHEWNLVGLRPQISGNLAICPNVRLSFRADRPFFPYREPPWRADDRAIGKGRVLRVTVIAPEQVAWQVGPSLPTMGPAWISFEVTHEDLKGAFGGAYGKLFDASKRYWLTSFEDWHEVRPGNDDLTLAHRGPIPDNGAPGTIGDKTSKGIELEPMSTPPLPEEPKAKAKAKQPGEQARAGRRLGRNGRGLVAFGAVTLLALGAFAWMRREA